MEEQNNLIPEKYYNPAFIFWAMILPQVLLVISNINSWLLIRGEMTLEQKDTALVLFAFQIFILLFASAAFTLLRHAKAKVNLHWCVPIFLLCIGYLWLFAYQSENMFPDTVTLWILPPMQAVFYQLIFIMPAVFYTGTLIACFKSKANKRDAVARTVAVLILTPLTAYTAIAVIDSGLTIHIPDMLLMVFFIAATSLTMMAFLRVLVYIYLWLKNMSSGNFILLMSVGLVCPLAGLALNSAIPFPCDFQSIGVYAMTVLNGAVLMLAAPQGTKKQTVLWAFRCAMYPFSLYFFLVFLPFLPLSLFAMFAAGAGFLILAPTALFIIHTQKLYDESKVMLSRFGRRATLLVFAGCFAIMPAFIACRAFYDKYVLNNAINAVYSPDYSQNAPAVDPASATRCLLKLHDMKNGVFMPFISNFYNKVVFNSMALPDYKMQEMYRIFTGDELPDTDSLFPGESGRARIRRPVRTVMPPRDVDVSDISVTREIEGDYVRAGIRLEMTNQRDELSEFTADIQLGDGVLVSGYWLEIEGEKKAGHIFEKKAAMWVYHMIRDFTRRDPGLLVYERDNNLKLSIYPFGGNETRVSGIELLYPAGIKPEVKIDGQTVEIEPAEQKPAKPLLIDQPTEYTTALFSAEALSGLPKTERKPLLHFIVDCSIGAEKVYESFAKRMELAAQMCPDADECLITLANYEFEELTSSPAAVADISKLMENITPETRNFKGGFCFERAIKHELTGLASEKTDINSAPIFVVIKATASNTFGDDLSYFAEFVPDVDRFYILENDCELSAQSFGRTAMPADSISAPAASIVLKYGDAVKLCTAGSESALCEFPDSAGASLEVYNAETAGFEPIDNVMTLKSKGTYSSALAAWDEYRSTVYMPASAQEKYEDIVKMSKESGVLVPTTSYIVLENSAQEEMLRRKEAQALDSNMALEFDEFIESPAPPALIIAPVVAFMLYRLRKGRQSAA